MSYSVYIDDNGHYHDESHRRRLASFDSFEAAEEAARRIVDDWLLEHRSTVPSAKELFELYCHYGEDPFIIGPDCPRRFSARDYAKRRCEELPSI